MRTRRPIVAGLAAVLLAGAAHSVADRATARTTWNLGQRYEIAATLDVARGMLDAVETVVLENRASVAIDHVNLVAVPRALGYFETTGAVTVDEVEAVTEWTTSINLRVELPEPLKPRDEATVEIPFRLTLGTSAPPFTARVSSENGVLSFGQWFPIVSREHEVYGIGDPQMSFTAESIRLELETTAPLRREAVACAGLQEAPAATGTRWTCTVEDVRDFSFVVNPDFRLTTRVVDDVEVRVYTETVDGRATADLAERALIGLEEAFGPYPWPDLVLAEIGGGGGFSMEYPRSIHLTRTKVTDPYVVYHEVAHQWFYGMLGNDQMREPWIDEGFADFAARYLMGIGENHCSTRPVDSEVYAWPAGPISGGDWTSCDGYFHAVFYQGSEFLNAVREAMGAEAFFAAMREFIERHRFDVVTGRRLLDHLQRRTEADLGPIYATYLSKHVDLRGDPQPTRPTGVPARPS